MSQACAKGTATVTWTSIIAGASAKESNELRKGLENESYKK